VVARCSDAVAALLAASLLGCAAQREARVRKNWNATPGASAGAQDPGQGPAGEDEDDTDAVSQARGWRRVEELLTRTTDVLLTAPSPEVLAELAAKWCEVEPIPRQTQHGEVRVCYLYPPVRVDGVALTLELSELGVVGFVAPELDDIKSQRLVAEARRALGHLCEHSWAIATAGLDIKTCTVDGGSTLAVGRLKPEPDADRWQVSVAVLGAI